MNKHVPNVLKIEYWMNLVGSVCANKDLRRIKKETAYNVIYLMENAFWNVLIIVK